MTQYNKTLSPEQASEVTDDACYLRPFLVVAAINAGRRGEDRENIRFGPILIVSDPFLSAPYAHEGGICPPAEVL